MACNGPDYKQENYLDGTQNVKNEMSEKIMRKLPD
jgi:hypothetical protein